jgi:hypothetical protein
MRSHLKAPLTARSHMARVRRPSEAHLSEAQIDDFIIGDAEPSAAAHLARCPLCTERVTVASASLSSFNTLATTWSERVSASLPAPLPQAGQSSWLRPLALAAPCFVLLVGFMVLHTTYVDKSASRDMQSNAADEGVEDQAQQSRVSADDRMLDAIDSDMDFDSDTPTNLGLRPVSVSLSPSIAPSVRD